MYIPRFNVMDDPDDIRAFVEAVGSAELVTIGSDGTPVATLLPVLWSADGGTVIAHMALANDHWRQIGEGARCLAIVAGPQAYISPSWYAAKAEHGRVVPTWNYSAVHLTGTVRVHDDPAWVRDAVTRLTDHHEHPREQPWAVTDAPETYIAKNLKAIVGLELTVERVEAKAKLSQNRSDADRAGVVAGLRAEGGDPAVADAMDD
ncbi:transcriptional regulator [Aeromicrobium sp. Root236]|uniref:FMN-binding negative transcriptional regulator n=1 Tax=Aeromicrobium sp. Root236 TaxID=1736498 RepID=UPI00070055C3|nr:FMN-binding negative transcriptional regulator [Aeromicrobium sp. Root236]KRC66587.1 transcriptional regulator [Aeromicrobium sp. Root236]